MNNFCLGLVYTMFIFNLLTQDFNFITTHLQPAFCILSRLVDRKFWFFNRNRGEMVEIWRVSDIGNEFKAS